MARDKLNHDALASVSKELVRHSNRIRRIFEDEKRKSAYHRTGVQINSKRLVNGVIQFERGIPDRKLYTSKRYQTEIMAGFSFATDHSGSLGYGANSEWAQICLLIGSMHKLADKLGIKSQSGLVRYRSGCALNVGATNRDVPVVTRALPLDMPWKDDYLEPIYSSRPGGGTSLTAYATAAIEMALEIPDCTHRIAFFLTDGDSSDRIYLESLRQQALSKGVVLIGIGIGQGSRVKNLPNAISGQSALEIASKMCEKIAEHIKKKD